MARSKAKNLTKAVAKRKRSSPISAAPRSNPPIGFDVAYVVVPALGAYAGTRLVGRIARGIAKKRSPKMAKHAGALAPALFTAGLWATVHRFDRLLPYHDGILAGSFVASVQSLLQNYAPMWGWVLDDFHDESATAMVNERPPPDKNAVAELPEESATSQGAVIIDDYSGEILDDLSDLPELREGMH
ncbi:MAG: hypothetical protein R3322_00085 [Kiloniellales bacterium]|nr:hypothetical protein [Kiloniellales bacterium]